MTEEQAGLIIATWIVVVMAAIVGFIAVAQYSRRAKADEDWEAFTHNDPTIEDKARS